MKTYSLNVALFGGDQSQSIPVFIDQFCSALYSGKGTYPTFLKGLGITPDFPMRCFVGISEDQFTPAKRLLAEAYCQHLVGMDTVGLWSSENQWNPINPSRVSAPLERCLFDVKWALTLGLSRARWESEVLMSSSALTRQAKTPDRDGIFEQNVRLMLALAVYGFKDPMQFFTASESAR